MNITLEFEVNDMGTSYQLVNKNLNKAHFFKNSLVFTKEDYETVQGVHTNDEDIPKELIEPCYICNAKAKTINVCEECTKEFTHKGFKAAVGKMQESIGNLQINYNNGDEHGKDTEKKE